MKFAEHYKSLKNAEISNMDPKTSTRIPGSLAAAINLRDVGGFQTNSGYLMKTGLLYRSGNLEKTSVSDRQTVSELHITTFIDFRSQKEQEKSPGDFPACRKVSLSCNMDQITAERLRPLLMRKHASDEIYEVLNGTYVDLVDLMVKPIGGLIRILLNAGNHPVLMHCRAGKDRTGFGAAVIQQSLGVDRDIIFQEYLRSNEFIGHLIDRTMKQMRFFTLGLFPRGDLRAAFEVRSQYLQTAFSAIESTYGGLENYLAAGGITNDDLIRLKELLLVTIDN
jgi:protein-tyrosine phosphatase